MNENNICRFVPKANDHEAIHVIHFVLQRSFSPYTGLRSNSVYQLHLVIAGTGILHTPGHVQELQKGDLFFVLPAVPFAIENSNGLESMYISYIGPRANMIMDNLKINSQNLLFHAFEELIPFWTESLHSNTTMLALRSESVLLYTFSVLGSRFFNEETKEKKSLLTAALAKKYIDENFSDTEFSLDKMGQVLSYSKKYLSTAFKEEFQIGITEYLNTVRIQHACTLMEQGFTSIKDIALLCGFHDPLYFSRVFKKAMLMSPKEHMTAQERRE